MDKITLARVTKMLGRNGSQGQFNQSGQTNQVKTEKIVDYPFEKNEKANVLAIHPTKPLIAYLITIQRAKSALKTCPEKIDPNSSLQDCSYASINSSSSIDQNKTVSIRVIDYVTRQKCLARGIYHARPADCAFIINSLICARSDIVKLAIVDRLSNVYIYDLSYLNDDLISTRTLVIRSPFTNDSPTSSRNLVWCPYVPCEDYDDGDGGLRLALATNTCIEIFAIDRLNGKTGELQRSELKGAYKLLKDTHTSKIVSLNISPDCSTISAAAEDNKVRFFSIDIDDTSQKCLHNWEAKSVEGSIAKLFFLDDNPKLLEDSNINFWGAALLATKSAQIILIDLKTWTIYQSVTLKCEGMHAKNFDYQIDFTSKCVIAICGQNSYVVQLDRGTPTKNTFSTPPLPKITKVTRFPLHSPIYSFVVKYRSDEEIDLFTISANSLERFTINLNAYDDELTDETTSQTEVQKGPELKPNLSTPNDLQALLQQFGAGMRISSSATTSVTNNNSLINNSLPTVSNSSISVPSLAIDRSIKASPSTSPPKSKHPPSQQQQLPQILLQQQQILQPPANSIVIDRMVETLFAKLNHAFSQGLEEFLNDVKSEVNDLKMKVGGLSREVRKLQVQLQDSKTR